MNLSREAAGPEAVPGIGRTHAPLSRVDDLSRRPDPVERRPERARMLEVTTVGWTLTIGVVVALLLVDLFGATLRPHAVGFREATAWTLFYIAVAVTFGVVLTMQAGGQYGTEYFAGFLVEWSLSVDNVFVFVIIMQRFAVPAATSTRCCSSASCWH
jgi:hypothetical protein